MSTRRNDVSRHQRVENFQGKGPNWIILAGGALLSTLSIRFGFKLKKFLDSKQQSNASCGSNVNGMSEKRSSRCCLHSNASSYVQNDDYGLQCITGAKNARDGKYASKEQSDLPLVTVSAPELDKENGVMWASSPDRLEPPMKPFHHHHHHSPCSDSPCVSESGSDIFSKREVIQKLRQQIKRRDDMTLEMQDQITELQNRLSEQISISGQIQAQLDATNRDMFDSEREVQRLRKVIADHCVGHGNGFAEGESNHESAEKVNMLRREVEELKEVIEGKEYLLCSYKEQKIELSLKIKELQMRLDSQVPSIL